LTKIFFSFSKSKLRICISLKNDDHRLCATGTIAITTIALALVIADAAIATSCWAVLFGTFATFRREARCQSLKIFL